MAEALGPEVDTEHDGGRRLVANAGFRSVAEIGSKLATFVLFAVLGRKLGERDFGIYAFALSIGSLATTLADFGQDKVLTREVARDPTKVEHLYGNTLALRLLVGLPVLAVVVAAVPLLGYGRRTQLTVLLVGLAVLCELLTTTCFAVFQALERMAYMPVVLVTERWLIAIGGIGAVLLGGSVVAVAAAFLASSVFGLVLAGRLLSTRVVDVRLTAQRRAWWPLMKGALPLGVAGVFSAIFFRVDMTMLAAIKDAAAVGNYGVAYRLFETTLFLSYSVAAGAYPVYARLSPSSSPAVGPVFARTLKLATALTVPLGVGAAVLAHPLVRLLFGPDFDEGAGALMILALPIATFPMSYLAGYLLTAQHRDRMLVLVYGLLAVENVVGNLILIPPLSLRGAAWSTAITQSLAALILLRLSQREIGGISWATSFVSPVVAGAAAAVVMWPLRDHLGVAIAAGAVVYAAAFAIVERRFFPGDASSLRGMLRPS